MILHSFYKTIFINELYLFFFCSAMAITCKPNTRNWNKRDAIDLAHLTCCGPCKYENIRGQSQKVISRLHLLP